MKRRTAVVLASLSLGLVIVLFHALLDDISIAMHEQAVRGECIAHYVSLGIERSDIETEGARCWVADD